MTQYEIAMVSAVVGALVGALITHRFQVGRDKRKEWNDVVIPAKRVLLKHNDQLKEGKAYHYLEEKVFDNLRVVFSESKFNNIKGEYTEYQKLYGKYAKSNSYGQVKCSYDACMKLSKKLENIIKLLKVK